MSIIAVICSAGVIIGIIYAFGEGSCVLGFYKDKYMCSNCSVPLGPLCDECSSESTCTGCVKGYYLDKLVPNTYLKCSDALGEPCLDCLNEETCT